MKNMNLTSVIYEGSCEISLIDLLKCWYPVQISTSQEDGDTRDKGETNKQ